MSPKQRRVAPASRSKRKQEHNLRSAKEKLPPEETLRVDYTLYKVAIEELERCFKSKDKKKDPRCASIVGPSGSGKSTIAETEEERHPAQDHEEYRETPVLYAGVPPRPTVKGLVQMLLKKLGDPEWDRGYAATASLRFQDYCVRCKVRLLLLDDCQHIVEYTKKTPYEVADWIKDQINKVKIAVGLLGLETCLRMFEVNRQLKRRFKRTVRLHKFVWKNRKDREEFRGFLASVKDGLPQYSLPDLGSVDFAHRMHHASFGLIGYAMAIIRGAIEKARDKRRRVVTPEDFAESFSECSWAEDLTGPNPFSKEFDPERAPVQAPSKDRPAKQGKHKGRPSRAKRPNLRR